MGVIDRRQAEVLARVTEIIAESTRYPPDLLTPGADIEDELGIDSVKRGEIAARIAVAFPVSREDLGGLQEARTISDLASRLAAIMDRAPSLPEESADGLAVVNGFLPGGRQGAGAEGVLEEVTAVVARVTRYPGELLTADADLEDELGIDSVKFVEILAALAEAYPGLADEARSPEQPARTLRELAARIGQASTRAVPSKPAGPTGAPAVGRARPERPLEGQVVFVSGSGRGLGRATAMELARRGAAVAVNSFHHREDGEQTAREIRDAGGTAEHLWGSMARSDQIDRVFDELAARFGRLDAYIHNASDGAFTTLAEATEDHWLKSFRTNVIGLHRAALRAAALMRTHGGGRVLTLSSVFHDAAVDYFGVQGTVKAAVESLTRFLAKELMPDGITVNCISFASLDGEVMRKYPEAERINGAIARSSFQSRRGDESEAARVLAMLLGNDSTPLTGAVIRADRGFALHGLSATAAAGPIERTHAY
jgi:enoyl-[acyl-carrier protein] reductase III